MSEPRFTGVMTALVTPFHDDGHPDLEAYKGLIDQQLEAGVHGLVPCGTTGEAATMTRDEQLAVIKTCVERVAGRVPVIAGAGDNATARAVDMHKRIADVGVDGSLQVTPWYNKPTQEGLFRHFEAVAASDPLPIVLYNVPGRTGVDLLPETVIRLAKACPSIVAIKEATGSCQRSQDLLCRLDGVRDDFTILSGDDGHILSLVAQGGHGVISVISHVCARDLVDMIAAFHAGDHDEAQRLSRKVSPLQAILFFRANPIPVKTAVAWRGLCTDAVRLPLSPLNNDDKNELRAGLEQAGYGS